MQISGLITTAGWKQNKAKTKEVFSFTIAPDDGSKHKEIWTNNDELQAQIGTMLNKHVTIEGQETESNGKVYFNINGVVESKVTVAPTVNSPQEVVSKVIPQNKETDWDMIGRQKARCSILQAAVQLYVDRFNKLDFFNSGEVIETAKAFEAYVFSPMPSKEPTFTKKAPEPVEAREIPMITGAQLFQLRKKVKATDDNDLLAKAEVFVGRALGCLNDITFDEADVWINKVGKK